MLGDWDPPTLPIGLVGHSFGAAGVGGKGITPHTHCVLAGDRVDGNPFGTATVEEDEEEEPDPACGSPGAGQVGWGGCMGLGGLYGAVLIDIGHPLPDIGHPNWYRGTPTGIRESRLV